MKLYIFKTIRADNNDEKLQDKILGLWESFREEYNTEDFSLYHVYHDYEGDYRKPYSVSLAVKEEPSEEDGKWPEIEWDADNKVTFESLGEDDLLKTWQHIWKLEDEGKLKRNYTVDVEEYLETGEVIIYIDGKINPEYQ